MDYDSMTVAQLKELADKHGVKYNTKTRKIDLIRAIDDATTIVAGVGTLAGRNSLEDQGWKPLGYTTEGDVFTTPIELPSVEQAHRMVEDFNTAYPRVGERIHTHKRTGQRVMVRMIRASQSRRYGQGGRGMGAKHYESRTNFFPVPIRAAIVGRGLTGAYGR